MFREDAEGCGSEMKRKQEMSHINIQPCEGQKRNDFSRGKGGSWNYSLTFRKIHGLRQREELLKQSIPHRSLERVSSNLLSLRQDLHVTDRQAGRRTSPL
jgi:hypothetical protein